MPKVTVISPIFNVEKFIGRAIESMLSQTLDDIEYIFVDDCTFDASIKILEETISKYPQRKEYIKIIHHQENKGLPSARNTGLKYASGDYIFHWDSDDFAEPTMLEAMYDYAIKNDFDIVWCDWWLSFEKKERRMLTPDYDNPYEALRAMLAGAMKYNVWNKLVRRSLYEHFSIKFPSGYCMGEDLTMLLLFAHAKSCGRLSKSFYHYVKTNSNAFTNNLRPEHFESLKRNVLWVANKLQKIYGQSIEKEIAFLKLQSKYPLLSTSGNLEYYRLWNNWFPEANRFITENRYLSLRSTLLQLMAKHKLYGLIYLHYWFVSKIIYGVIYK